MLTSDLREWRTAAEEVARVRSLMSSRDRWIKDTFHQLEQMRKQLEQVERRKHGNLQQPNDDRKGASPEKKLLAIHRVKAGETLQSIARHYYGSGAKWQDIYQANTDLASQGLLGESSTLVAPGLLLNVPDLT